MRTNVYLILDFKIKTKANQKCVWMTINMQTCNVSLIDARMLMTVCDCLIDLCFVYNVHFIEIA